MESLLKILKDIQRSEIKEVIKQKIIDFKKIGKESIERIFKELCFCIMTANCSAQQCINVQEAIDDGFLTLSEEQLAEKFKLTKYRFPNIRAKYIIEARAKIRELEMNLKSQKNRENFVFKD